MIHPPAFALFRSWRYSLKAVMADERLILIPGMGADRRLFGPQRDGGLAFEVPDLPTPGPKDDMARYARRVRDLLKLDGPCVIGGVSFGGMLAYQLGTLCQARCVLLIASCRGRSAIPRYYRGAQWVSRLLPDVVIRRRCIASSRMLAKLESLTDPQYRLIRDMSADVPVPFLRRAGRMILNWDAPATLPCPVHAIHGTKDRIIPVRGVAAEEVVPDGGHLINLTHAEQVNRFITCHLNGA